jgi:uncharacterized protein YxeA
MNEQKALPMGAIIAAVIAVLAIIGFAVYRFNQPDGGSGGGPGANYNEKDYAAKQQQIQEERSKQSQQRTPQGQSQPQGRR